MKVKLLALLMVFCFIVAGCNANNEEAKEETKGTETNQEITFMIPDWGTPSDELLKQFKEETGISVIVNEVSWDDIRDKISIASVGGKAAADVVEVDWSWAGEFASAGWLEPLNLDAETIADIPTLANFTVNNQILAVPYANDYRIAYYNMEHFKQAGIEEAPKTWDEVYQAMKAIKAAGIVEYPYTMPLIAEEATATSMTWMAISRSERLFNDDNTLNDAAMLDALTFVNQMKADQLMDSTLTTISGMDAYRKVLSGEASFMVGPTSFTARSVDPEQTSVVGQIMPILLPGISDVSKATTALPEGIGILANSEKKEAAAKFVNWYTSPEVQKQLQKDNSAIPTRTSVLTELVDNGTLQNPGAMLEASKMIVSAYPNGVPNYYSELSNAMYNAINKMAVGEYTPEQATEEISAKAKELAGTK